MPPHDDKLKVTHCPVKGSEITLGFHGEGELPEVFLSVIGPEIQIVSVKSSYLNISIYKQAN